MPIIRNITFRKYAKLRLLILCCDLNSKYGMSDHGKTKQLHLIAPKCIIVVQYYLNVWALFYK